ncbi:4Fe-4S dicluster domain-containing protein [Persicimonas caeni]|uniref:4Fe-4S dicluster domain-containing protein n=1 Tax=Persicimonas caeni TaxID=2292766 RepID=A0A4Y6PRM1_PERCE|nr:TAT-variant-translocated molybdopterin oxidoreductase [Persicimonas caeni]QDG50435.1 4Fe-4S dicluster domain-containing protein [Persicimonas caeni]QED31656.1 4Fe-4S dicluster domain-containing protein [Persicimonas caeni]
MADEKHSLEAMRQRLEERAEDDRLWQTLAELDTPEKLQQWAKDEFPEGAFEWPEGASRRQFLQLMGASLVMAGAAGCAREPEGDVVPYVKQPEQVVPGEPLCFASAFLLDGFANGVLVESHAGRPTKVEGNALHPTSLGSADAFAQASTWSLYDPERSQAVLEHTEDAPLERTWTNFTSQLRAHLGAKATTKGQGVRVLTETVTSPTLAGQLDAFLEEYPEASWHHWSPINRDNMREGTERAFGRVLHPRYHFDKADLILAVDSDFLHRGPGRLRYAHDWAERRKATKPDPKMNRMYAVEATFTVTGSMADNRLRMDPRRIEGFLRAVARRLGVPTADDGFEPTPREQRWVEQVARDLRANRGASVVVPGLQQPPAVHALAHAINAALDNVGTTVTYSVPVAAQPEAQLDSLRQLARDIDAGEVDTLVILGGNPVYNAPADLALGELLQKIDFSVHLSTYFDETSEQCRWHVPRAHTLEAWTDARANDGTITILQPLIEPLYKGKSTHEMLDAMLGNTRRGHVILMERWRERFGEDRFPRLWRRSLHDGMVPDTVFGPESVTVRGGFDVVSRRTTDDGLTVIFAPDPSVWDGRFANIGMLQELPKPLSSLTWDNAALISPKTSARLGLENEDVVELTYRERTVEAPVWVMPGHADGCVTVRLGYGKKAGGSLEKGRGFNAYALRTSEALWFDGGLELRKTERTYPLAATQGHHRMYGRPIVRHATLDEFREERAPAQNEDEEHSLYPEYEYDSYAWGMSIDQTLCIGCGACVAACQAENNIPIVGKEQVRMAREMHWIRVDTYYEGSADEPNAYHQPVPCMHCEKAPCELVCPVEATSHSAEGLNEMTYNRCIGTRYCSNNCPYKVRRFNFLDYTHEEKEKMEAVLDLKYNPDVTVRSRGVMEKCTYCVQRINAARVEAKTQDRRIRDGEIETACQEACPTQAIVFGDTNDPNTRVAKLKAQPHDYALLDELNTRPRTTYLTAITNPNPKLRP